MAADYHAPDRSPRARVETRAMLGLLFLAVAMPLLVPATPSPAPAANLPEIGRVRSTTLCTTLRTNIAPTVLGLMKNDEIIGAGHRAFAKMAHDQAGTSSGVIDIDKLYLEQVETRLVHNLKVIDTLLSDDKHFPAAPKDGDERDALIMKSQLLAVADQQRKALDLVSGTLETEALGQMQGQIDNQMKSATGQSVVPPAPTSDPVSFIGTAGLPEYTPVAGLPTTSNKSSTLGGHSIYDSIASALEGTQSSIARREAVATASVVNAVSSCRATITPSPAPSTTP
jgi:hypothetical protein